MVCPRCKHERTRLHDRYGKNNTERYKCLDCSSTFSTASRGYISRMNISKENQNRVLDMLVEGISIRSISRLTGVHKNTVMSLLEHAGNKCMRILDNTMKNLPCKAIECDEI